MAGKGEWLASGGPIEGKVFAGRLAEEVPTCRLVDHVGDVRRRAGDRGPVVVTSDDGIVFGRLTRDQLAAQDTTTAQEILDPAPVSTRYDEAVPDLVQRMPAAGVSSVLVTEPTGRLIGVFKRGRGEHALREHHEHLRRETR